MKLEHTEDSSPQLVQTGGATVVSHAAASSLTPTDAQASGHR